jgi:VCBS repeat-containing protein
MVLDLADVAAPSAGFVYTPALDGWQALAAGETGTETFTYSVTDADGDVRTASVTVVVAGSNDGPLIAAGAAGSGQVFEADGAGELTAGGRFASPTWTRATPTSSALVSSASRPPPACPPTSRRRAASAS